MKIKINFIRKPSGNIELRYHARFAAGKRLTVGTGVCIKNPAHWLKNENRQKARTKDSIKNNDRLNLFESTLSNLLSLYTAKGVKPTIEQLRNELKEAIGEGEQVIDDKVFNFNEYCDIFIENTIAKGIRSKGTIAAYKTGRAAVKDFLAYKYKSKKALEFSEVNLRFSNDFISYLKNKGVKSNNTIDKYLKFIHVVMNAAREEGYHTAEDYKKIKRFKTDIENVYLSEQEILDVYKLDLTAKKSYEVVRDLFLIGTQTGLRFSDFTNIQKNNIVKSGGTMYINMMTQKTQQRIMIPVTDMAHQILEKYNYELPATVSNQKFNKYIKEVCSLAGIDQVVSLKTGAGVKTSEKYKLVSSHTARRTFATNAFLSGMQTMFIMAITGHATEQQFMKYIAISNAEKAKKASEAAFYTESIQVRLERQTKLRKVL